ncbi:MULTISPECIES: aldo/keto reductase [Gordonibacter]|uniref:Aldo/keto reductase n=1 Tax=Gordonibacter faecis TaxID=3047475 RepID=A0ABT7DQH6_9ACTN|nr:MULTISPECIES: aldo/keto reductase [unclassified Gordonibacter]MDJ1651786.1 aldo/keto reductase [Gordonibacter sp. KGMB12511]HIW75681.1 aldo/keto reductase [Candidatus Gordonibacter avicola]
MTYTGGEIPKLGFGFMRLPEVEGSDGEKVIDLDTLCGMVDTFMDAGFTYFDTARGYHGGRSEAALKAALVDRYPRESFTVATKLPAWMAKDADDARSMFETSLEQTGAGYFDFFLLHNLGEDRTHLFDDWGLWDFLAEKKAAGLIRNLGFSIHDKAAELERILAAHPEMDFVQLQINYADWESETVESRKCYEVARAHGLPIVVMEPIKGGSLVKLPDAAADVLRAANPDEPLPSWALRFAASLSGVLTVLSGMSMPEQVQENVGIMRDFKPLAPAELDALAQVRAILDGIPTVPCTDCRYCVKSCPEGVRIPAALASLNILALYRDEYRAQENYDWNASAGPASSCIGCGTCESVCPQHIGIVKELARAAELFE